MSFTKIRNQIERLGYRFAAKPLFFLLDPEYIHDRMTATGQALGTTTLTRLFTRLAFDYRHPALQQELCGLTFANPIGLAAGFDKNARLTQILPSVGFGLMEAGSITGEACAGNPGQRLWRLPKSRALVVYYGLKNDGAESIAARLANKQFTFPVGISLAKTNSPATVDTDAGIADYLKVYRTFRDIGSYFTINISCPNAYGGQPFTDPVRFSKLLKTITREPKTKPIFIKLSPDLPDAAIDRLVDLALASKIDGFICTNLTERRDHHKIKDAPVPPHGGLSGKLVQGRSDRLVKHVYERVAGQAIVIGCGGVFTAEDAYRKIRLGASLFQLITGMIYQGPQTISDINQGLVTLLQRDGFSSISEAIGADTAYPANRTAP